MTILKVTYGNPVASIKGICEHYQISDRTARMIVKELEQERGRYGDYTVLGDGALKRVNFLAFTDYWQFRKMLQDKNARKHVPVYSPQRLNCIVSLAQKYNVAVVIICHFNKNGKGDAITRVMGSTDIMGICRSYIALGNVPGEEDIKYMSHEKSSLERKGKTILFEIDPDRGGIVYVGENALSMDDYTAIRNKKRAFLGTFGEAIRTHRSC